MHGIDSKKLRLQFVSHFNWWREDISAKYCSMYVSSVKGFTMQHVVRLGIKCFWNRWTDALSLSTLLTSWILHTENRHSLFQCHHDARMQHNYVQYVNLLNTELNPICHLLALLGAHHIFHVSWLRVKFGNHRVWTTYGACM